MNKLRRHRLARLAIALLNATTKHGDGQRLIPPSERVLTFRMLNFSEDKDRNLVSPCFVHTCGTSCCFLGYAPMVFPAVRHLGDWGKVSEWALGLGESADNAWDFLFDGGWPDDTKHAAVRTLYLLDHHNEHPGLNGLPNYVGDPQLRKMMKWSKPKILAALANYLIHSTK